MALKSPVRLPVQAVVFDLDGTLIDSRGDIAASCNHALVQSGRKPLPVTRVSALVGDGAVTLLSRAAGIVETDPEIAVLLASFLGYYEAHPIGHTILMPHVESTLASLTGFRLAICTNKPRRTTEAVLAALGLEQRFTAVVAGDDLAVKKPDPGQLEALAKVLRLVPAELVMVGDGPQDVLAGRAAGTRTIGVRGGFLPEYRLLETNPDVVIDDLSAVPALVRSWSESTVVARPSAAGRSASKP